MEIFLDFVDEVREKWEDKFIVVEYFLFVFYKDKCLGNKFIGGGIFKLLICFGFECF